MLRQPRRRPLSVTLQTGLCSFLFLVSFFVHSRYHQHAVNYNNAAYTEQHRFLRSTARSLARGPASDIDPQTFPSTVSQVLSATRHFYMWVGRLGTSCSRYRDTRGTRRLGRIAPTATTRYYLKPAPPTPGNDGKPST